MNRRMIEQLVWWQQELSDDEREFLKRNVDKPKGETMKKTLAILAVMVMLGGAAYAGGYDPCTYPAYSYCAEKLKFAEMSGPGGTKVCRVNSRSEEFKQCEKDAVARCRSGQVLDTTVKPC